MPLYIIVFNEPKYGGEAKALRAWKSIYIIILNSFLFFYRALKCFC